MVASQDNLKQPDFDTAVVRSLAKLTDGHAAAFAEQTSPPDSIGKWIQQANLQETHGLLCLALRRWHELQPPH